MYRPNHQLEYCTDGCARAKFPDLSGQRFGRLLALDYAGRIYDNSNSEAWRCQCDCGALTVVLASSLRYGLTRSCGCLRRERARRPGYVEDLQGHRFGRLLVLGPATKRDCWRCLCACGVTNQVAGHALRRGGTKSCGCLRREASRDRASVHGGADEPLYQVWKSMKDCCFNPNSPRFATHGGLGVVVSEAWRDDYAAFRFWARANGYRGALASSASTAMVTTRPAIAPGCRIVTGSGTAVSIGWSAAATTASSRP